MRDESALIRTNLKNPPERAGFIWYQLLDALFIGK